MTSFTRFAVGDRVKLTCFDTATEKLIPGGAFGHISLISDNGKMAVTLMNGMTMCILSPQDMEHVD